MHLEENFMQKIFNISGMMCPHCENRVKKAVSALNGVSDVIADSKSGTCAVVFDGTDEADIIKAITDAGYTVK